MVTPSADAPLPISNDEPLTRFAFDDSHVKAGAARVHWRAFRPKPSETELSIARIEHLALPSIWGLGDDVGRPSNRVAVGRADFSIPLVRSTRAVVGEMDAIPAEPPVRHAVIIGWPIGNEEARKTVSMMLAAEATAHRRTL